MQGAALNKLSPDTFGPESPFRHALRLHFEGGTFESIIYVADIEIDREHSHDALHVSLTKNAVVALFPMPGENRYRIVGAFPEEVAKTEGEILGEEIEGRIKAVTAFALFYHKA